MSRQFFIHLPTYTQQMMKTGINTKFHLLYTITPTDRYLWKCVSCKSWNMYNPTTILQLGVLSRLNFSYLVESDVHLNVW